MSEQVLLTTLGTVIIWTNETNLDLFLSSEVRLGVVGVRERERERRGGEGKHVCTCVMADKPVIPVRLVVITLNALRHYKCRHYCDVVYSPL